MNLFQSLFGKGQKPGLTLSCGCHLQKVKVPRNYWEVTLCHEPGKAKKAILHDNDDDNVIEIQRSNKEKNNT